MEGSVIYQFLVHMASWFSNQLQNSRLIQFFLKSNENEEMSKDSIFYKIYAVVKSGLQRIFYGIYLNKVFQNSIFKMSFIWCILAVVIAPFMPTMVVFATVLAGCGSLFIDFLYDKKRNLQYYPINKYIYLYIFAYLFAIFTSVTPKGSLLGGLLTISFILFSIVLTNAIETRKQMDVMLFLFISIGVLVACYGFYQFLFPSKFSGVWHDKEMFEGIRFRVYSTLENPNVLGEYFLLVIPIAFAYFLNSKAWISKLYFLGCCGAMMLCLILTYSRGCYIGILVALGIFLVLLDRRFIFLGILGLLALPFILPPTIINRFLSIGDMADSSTSYRVYIWLGTLSMLKDYWVCGIGPGTSAFNMVYPAYAFNGISAPHSHNLFLQIICDAGIVGILLFAVLIYQFYKATFRAFVCEKRKENRILIISAISAISGFLVQSLFDYTFYNYRVMLLFWVVLAFGILFTRLPQLREGRNND